MRLEMTGQMRMDQRMKLAPRMIQSMEILQLPILALQERIEQELNSNPVLELDEPLDEDADRTPEQTSNEDVNEKELADTTGQSGEDFESINNLDDDYKEYMTQTYIPQRRVRSDEPDLKLEAIKNTAAPQQSLHEYLSKQWGLVDADEKIKNAGTAIIDYIDGRGYIIVRLEQLYNKDKSDFSIDDLNNALDRIQKLDPVGIGARDLKECLLIQMAQNGDYSNLEYRLISQHMQELLENRLPDIAKKMNCSLEQLNHAIEHMSKLDTSPGLQIGQQRNHPITADVIVEQDSDTGEYIVKLADSSLPALKVNDSYKKMAKDTSVNNKTRKFLQSNIHSAQWIIEAIEQRKNTLLRVASSVVRYQKKFFDKGQFHLQPLPMSKVADDVGVHLATVSRAVAGKYIQCSWGILPLRKFFSGGTEDTNGQSLSWEAIRAKLQQIVNDEDKSKPLSDDKIRKKLVEMGIENLARRTVAKYRKLLNIPSARFRKKY
ncbi:MAG: RNA polymerase factor sigma-54 [Planctomycetes bacterium]|nr:RNA polymerase factor sigma-54 [Planctomycetota bacterium]